MSMTILITGGCGFLGSNLAAEGLRRGHRVWIADNLSRTGAAENLAWLSMSGGELRFAHTDLRLAGELDALVERASPDAIFHLAGQVAMTSSIRDPLNDFLVNAQGTLHVLEALRHHCPQATLIYASTNKVYGELDRHPIVEGPTRYRCPQRPQGFAEDEPLDFHSPYGCSKGSADQYCLDYARIYGLRTVVLRHSSMYGGRQFATEDQGWVGWFCARALEHRSSGRYEAAIHGNGKQVRDLLHAWDACRVYYACVDAIDAAAGRAFNVGGGMDNSLSLLELFSVLEEKLGIAITTRSLAPRESDQKIFVADNTAITQATGWTPQIDCGTGLDEMLGWCSALANGSTRGRPDA